MLLQTEPGKGREQECNDWYDKVGTCIHLVAHSAIKAAQSFELRLTVG
jgi:hypothetical protein